MMQNRWLSEFSCLSEYTRLCPTGVDRKYVQIQFAIGNIQTLYRLIAFVILRVRCRDISCYGALSCDASGKYGLMLGKYLGANECYFPNILHRSFCFVDLWHHINNGYENLEPWIFLSYDIICLQSAVP